MWPNKGDLFYVVNSGNNFLAAELISDSVTGLQISIRFVVASGILAS